MEPMKPMQPMRPTGEGEAAWWPETLGQPASNGTQGELRYACFPEARRLAVERDGAVTVYDSGAYRITGVAQEQGLAFTSEDGMVALDDLRAAE